MAKGLGIGKVLLKFLRLHSTRRTLVFALNCNNNPGDELPLLDALTAEGVSRGALPVVINAEVGSAEREKLYAEGGCFLVTSRVLVMDLLQRRIQPRDINGFLVNDAHRVTETSPEAWAIRLYRAENHKGFLKAFTEEATQMAAGFHKVQKVMRHLMVQRLFLWPRFHERVAEELDRPGAAPEVVELALPLTSRMARMQQAIARAMDDCLKELKRSASIDVSDMRADSSLFKEFATQLRQQLEPVWHRLGATPKQLLEDLRTLRKCLLYLLRYDAATFWRYLCSLRAQQEERMPTHAMTNRTLSTWMLTDAADSLFRCAKERLYKLHPARGHCSARLEMELEPSPKWAALQEVLAEIRRDWAGDGGSNGGCSVLMMAHDENTCAQLRELLARGARSTMERSMLAFLESQRRARTQQQSGMAEDAGGRSGWAGQGGRGRGRGRGRGHSRGRGRGQGQKGAGRATANARASGTKPATAGISNGSVESKLLEVERKRLSTQFGRSSAHANTNEAAAERPCGMDSERPAAGEKELSQEPEQELELEILPAMHVSLFSYAEAAKRFSILEDLDPTFVVVVDPEVSFIRELEVFHAERCLRARMRAGGDDCIAPAMRVYFLMYERSIEERRYTATLNKERTAFAKLIEDKAHLIFTSAESLSAAATEKSRKRDGAKAGLTLSMDTRTRKRPKPAAAGPPRVVIDMREFRANLPSLLHLRGLETVPRTLEVGDFVLTPQLCIERKSLSDLFGSFGSGRLFKQAESMARHYQLPTLLVEFAQGQAFALRSEASIGNDISPTSITSKMVLLLLHCPQLRLLWSRNPHMTVNLFCALKDGQPEADVEAAFMAGRPEGEDGEDESCMLASQEMLRRLPGVTAHNYHTIMRRVRNMVELTKLSERQLIEMIGKAHGRRLWMFLHKNKTLPS